jgi:hypothetical protein
MARSNRHFALAGILSLVVLLSVFLLRSGDKPDKVSSGGDHAEVTGKGASSSQGEAPTVSAQRARTRDVGPAPSFPRVEAIIEDNSLTDAQAAEKLQELVAQEDVASAEKQEALEHAIILSSDELGKGLVKLAGKPALAPELAEMLLADFHNRKDPDRLAGAVALAKNDDASVREEAMELLRFLMDEGEGEEGTDVEILEKAESRLPPQERE